jgi:hypothetical protein
VDVTPQTYHFINVLRVHRYPLSPTWTGSIHMKELHSISIFIETTQFKVAMGFIIYGAILKGLSHEIDFKNFDKNLQNLT